MNTIEVKVPHIGDFADVPIVEIHVQPGASIDVEDNLITLESDKAAMDVPSPVAGKVVEVLIGVGDKVSEGSAILTLETKDAAASAANDDAGSPKSSQAPDRTVAAEPKPAAVTAPHPSQPPRSGLPPPLDFGNAHASPSVRMIARELGVDLTKIEGTGEKRRITKDDVKRALAGAAASAPATGGIGIPEIPPQDFSKFGEIETIALSRIKKLSGPHLHRAWLNVPHVTHTDEADITEVDRYRKELDTKVKSDGYRVTLLAFLLKASCACLKEFPAFNASLSPGKDALILKKYYNIGVAVDTPDGLVVPVIKAVDRKGIMELSRELSDVSARMRDGKITPADIQGATFSISSLGGIGGTNFTPIVSAPEVAILGVVRSQIKPVWDGSEFKPRNILPLCVSYDHRVIDGALAARFTRRMCQILEDVRLLVL